MSFIIYDLTLLVLFVIFISIFLYKRRKNLKKEGLLFLYKTEWGIKLINNIGNKYKKTLKILSYVSIVTGYFLMIGIFYLFYMLVKVYVSRPDIVSQIKVPPIMPLIPYVDKLVPGLPEFNFTYWIIILAIIAITHEFAHGIFAAYNKVKIKKTGFGFFPFFLPIFLAAFVELDEKKMAKKPKLQQMAILSAGTFANVLTAILFFGLIWLFFSLTFTPAGVTFDSYAYSFVSISSIDSVNNISIKNPNLEKIINLTNEEGFNEVSVGERNYLITKAILKTQQKREENILLFDSTPAIKSGILPVNEAIITINNVKITSREKLGEELHKYKPGEKIIIKTKIKDQKNIYEIILEEHPEKENAPWLGIGFFPEQSSSRIMGKISQTLSSFKDPNIYYESKSDGINWFIYYLLWWTALISISVALINMLPVGIFDGGRFFYLTILGLTKSEKIAKRTFSVMTYFFLFLLLVMMFFWIISFF